MDEKKHAFVALGANLGDAEHQVRQALTELTHLPKTSLLQSSSLYRSAPIGGAPQPDYINAVAEIVTSLSPRELLGALLIIEAKMGRQRSVINAPRTLDLDLLLYDSLQLQEKDLIIPHPRMHLRAFVLRPLLEISPNHEIPGKGLAHDWLAATVDQVAEKIKS